MMVCPESDRKPLDVEHIIYVNETHDNHTHSHRKSIEMCSNYFIFGKEINKLSTTTSAQIRASFSVATNVRPRQLLLSDNHSRT